MSELVFAVFSNRAIASKAWLSLKELGASGITIYDSAIIAKDIEGKIAVLESTKQGSRTTTVAALIGGLAGLPAGPVAAAIGVVGGALIGEAANLTDRGVEAEFSDQLSRRLMPGKVAVVADLASDGVASFEKVMTELGGTTIAGEKF